MYTPFIDKRPFVKGASIRIPNVVRMKVRGYTQRCTLLQMRPLGLGLDSCRHCLDAIAQQCAKVKSTPIGLTQMSLILGACFDFEAD